MGTAPLRTLAVQYFASLTPGLNGIIRYGSGIRYGQGYRYGQRLPAPSLRDQAIPWVAAEKIIADDP